MQRCNYRGRHTVDFNYYTTLEVSREAQCCEMICTWMQDSYPSSGRMRGPPRAGCRPSAIGTIARACFVRFRGILIHRRRILASFFYPPTPTLCFLFSPTFAFKSCCGWETGCRNNSRQGGRQVIGNPWRIISLLVTCLVNFQREMFPSVDLRDLMNDLNRLST